MCKFILGDHLHQSNRRENSGTGIRLFIVKTFTTSTKDKESMNGTLNISIRLQAASQNIHLEHLVLFTHVVYHYFFLYI